MLRLVNRILEQLCIQNLDIFLMFLCILKERSEIDNYLLDSMMHDANKGIGPAAQGEKMELQHCERWQEN